MLALMIILFGLTACQTADTQTPTQPVVAPATQTVTAALQPDPTITPTPSPDTALLFVPEGLTPALGGLQAEVEKLAAQSGLRLEIAGQMDANQDLSHARVVVLLARPDNFEQFLLNFAQAQFLLVSPVDVQPQANLTVLRWHPEWEVFLAGYAAMITVADWRVGALLPADGPLGARLVEAYVNGSRYFCGQCRSALSPIVEFPVVSSLQGLLEPHWL